MIRIIGTLGKYEQIICIVYTYILILYNDFSLKKSQKIESFIEVKQLKVGEGVIME